MMRTLTEELALGAFPEDAETATVMIVDDHQAVRLGIQMLLDDEPGVEVVGLAGSYELALDTAGRLRPDVAVVDYQLSERDGLTLTRELVSLASPPRVLIFSAYADRRLELAALLAGADAVLDKSSLGVELCYGVLALARGEAMHPPIPAESLTLAAEELEIEDRPILAMLAAGTELDEIAAVLDLSRSELETRRAAMLRRLKAPPDLPRES